MAHRLDHGTEPAGHVGRARPGQQAGNPSLAGILKGRIGRIEGINGPQPGSVGLGELLVVGALETAAVAKEAGTGARIDKARQHALACRVDPLVADGQGPIGDDSLDPALTHKDRMPLEDAVGNGV